jgi:L-fuconolactonase
VDWRSSSKGATLTLRIDSHQHFTPEILPSLLWPILKRNKFEGSVVVAKQQTVEDTRWLLRLTAEHEFVRSVVGWADLNDANVGATLDEFQRHPKFRGVCWSGEGEVAVGLTEVERRGLTLDVAPNLQMVAQVAERFPGLRIVIDHLGRLSLAPMPFDEWARGLEIAAQAPTVYGKLSGLITDTPTRWTATQFQPYARHALRTLRPDRVMFGSDWPSYLPVGTWKEALAAFTQAIGAQTMEVREQLLGGTAMRFYGESIRV